MRHLGDDQADVRLDVPEGWLEVDPGAAVGYAGGRLLQLIRASPWDDADGVRPTMSLGLAERTSDHVATRVLAEAGESLDDLHLVSVDPWTRPPGTPRGSRLVFAHVEGEAAVTTIVWTSPVDDCDLVVAAQVESIHLHRHERALLEALAGIELRDPSWPGRVDDVPDVLDLLRAAPASPWEPAAASRGIILAAPDARILVEASVAATSLRLDATLVRDRATVTATSSPRTAGAEPTGTDRPDTDEVHATTFRIPARKLALTIARWLGLGPARTPSSEPLTLPISLVMNRLVDASVPPPEGADLTTWEQPWFLWTFRSSATDSGLVMVDTGDTGQCAVMETADEHTTRFAPLSSYNVWLTLNWLVSESLTHR
jgi:hypothetical protein